MVSIATSLQESTLERLGHLGDRNDHDSLAAYPDAHAQWEQQAAGLVAQRWNSR